MRGLVALITWIIRGLGAPYTWAMGGFGSLITWLMRGAGDPYTWKMGGLVAPNTRRTPTVG